MDDGTLNDAAIEAIAAELRQGRRSGVPCEPIRRRYPAITPEIAYAVQEVNTRHAIASGARLIGRKIGLTSPSVQKQLGVDQPDYGMLFEHDAVESGGSVARSRFLQPKAEAEIAFIAGRDLLDPDVSEGQVRSALECALVAIEVPDSRIARWDIGLCDTVADNASSGIFVLGNERRGLDALDLTGCRMEMTENGTRVSEGSGAACLGSPLIAVQWLARKMVQVGRPLRAGDLVLSGALGPMVSVKAGCTYEAHVTGLGRASVAFT